MILDVFLCSQLFSDVFSWVVTIPCADILWSSCSRESLVGPRCFCWKPNSTKFDHLGTGGHWKTISGSFSIPFGSGLEFKVSLHLLLSCFSLMIWMDFNDPKEFDDPRYSMIPGIYSMIKRKYQLEEWTLIIQKSTVIPPSAMVLFELVKIG